MYCIAIKVNILKSGNVTSVAPILGFVCTYYMQLNLPIRIPVFTHFSTMCSSALLLFSTALVISVGK